MELENLLMRCCEGHLRMCLRLKSFGSWVQKKNWLAGDVPAARAILQEAYAAIPYSEEIWLAAFKLEFENHEPERAKMLFAKARERRGTVKRELSNLEEERRLLDEGLQRYPSFFKLWLMLGKLHEKSGDQGKAKESYESGLKNCPHCNPLCFSLETVEEKMSGLSKARAVLTMARKWNPQNPKLWLAAVKAELRHGNKKEVDNLLAKAPQEYPTSGIIWATQIENVPLP
ncbi:Protein STABILIZED1 [Bienertia sinuspersici]